MNIRVNDLIPSEQRTRAVMKCCPFCGAEPGLAVKQASYWLVGCDNEECRVSPQAGSNTSEANAWRDWNCRAVIRTEVLALQNAERVLVDMLGFIPTMGEASARDLSATLHGVRRALAKAEGRS